VGRNLKGRCRGGIHSVATSACLALLIVGTSAAPGAAGPAPILAPSHPVNWWFVFKFNAQTFPDPGNVLPRSCAFGGTPQLYKAFSQTYIVASSENHHLVQGPDRVGAGQDPVGATFGQVYGGAGMHYVVWNDQFYDAPKIAGCLQSCSSPWGHSKGVLAWDDAGEGFIMQVTTPSWPAAGSAQHPRVDDGNTLGCVKDDDVEVSQHFFALRLTKDDLIKVLKGLANASVVTDIANPELVSNGGPADVQNLVTALGQKSTSQTATVETLSTGITMISKPSKLNVPPWQLVSSLLGGAPLRAATWWTRPAIPSTTSDTPIACWASGLGAPGAVDIAVSGSWAGKPFGLKGGLGTDFNHAKIGVTTAGSHPLTIFGDMNQQGAISGKCGSSQNGRGGMFFAVEDDVLHSEVGALIAGGSAPLAAPTPAAP
jgi:hypothetical protein